MDTETGQAGARVVDSLLAEPWAYSFFQVIRLLQSSTPECMPIGHQGPPAREALRLRPALSLGFPAADVSAVIAEERESGPRFTIETTFFGLYGTTSPLPSRFTEELVHETSEESIVKEFLDLFHHRLLSFHYRCWEKYRYYVQYRDRGTDPFSRRMLSLAGLIVPIEETSRVVPRHRLLRYVGLASRRPLSALGLKAAVSDYFDGTTTRIQQWVLRWVKVPQDLHNRLGSRRSTLGRDLHLGEMVRDRAGKFRVVLGPLKLGAFLALLPGEPRFRALTELVSLLVVDQLEFDAELVIEREEIPEFRLESGATGGRLGQTTWLGRPSRDERIIFQPRRESGLPSPGTGAASARPRAA